MAIREEIKAALDGIVVAAVAGIALVENSHSTLADTERAYLESELAALRSENAELRKNALTPEEAKVAWKCIPHKIHCQTFGAEGATCDCSRGPLIEKLWLRSTESSLRAPVK